MAAHRPGQFSAVVSSFVAQTEKRMTAVFKESTQRVVDSMQQTVKEGGSMPVDTGYLRGSLDANLALPRKPTTRTGYGTDKDWDRNQTTLVIAAAKLGKTIYATYSANYAKAVELGYGGRRPRAFVRLAAQRWPHIVRQVCAEVKTRVMGKR